jgi:hypothetical protein
MARHQPSPADREEARFVGALIIGGIALRLLWLWLVHGALGELLDAGEASRVALAFAQHGSLADAFFPGQGPTAHLLPVSPGIAGGVLWLFGPSTTTASLALLGWSLVQTFGAILMLRAVFKALGASPATLRWGTALLCLFPIFAQQETIDFRYWEGALAMALGAANLVLLARLDRLNTFSIRDASLVAILSAVTFFVSPPVGLACDLCWAIFALRRLPLVRVVQFALLSGAALAVLIAPWALRNQRVLGEAVLLRSNFGLELAVANHPAALSNRAPEYAFADRLRDIHPSGNPKLMSLIKERGGEVRYARALGEQSGRWIAANPAAFAQLYVRHVREFFFPRPWQMYFTGWEGMREGRAYGISIVSVLGLAGLFIGLRSRRQGYWMLAVFIAALALPFGLFQPMARYIYLTYGLLAFLAVEAVVTLGAGALRRSTPGHKADQ